MFMIYTQLEYVIKYKNQTIEPDDFSIWYHLDTKDY